MIAIPADDVAGIGQEQSRILWLHLKVLRRNPEIVEHQQTVFVGQIVENILGVLPSQLRMMLRWARMQPEIGFERSRDMRLRESSMPSFPRAAMRTPLTG